MDLYHSYLHLSTIIYQSNVSNRNFAYIFWKLEILEGVVISALFGAIYGATWIILWWRFGSPVLSVLLPVAFIGYLTSCVVFYTDFGMVLTGI